MREELGLIQEEASRARDIVRDLLQFSRQRDFSPESADVNTVLEQVVAMVRRQGALKRHHRAGEVRARSAQRRAGRVAHQAGVPQIINNAVYVMPNGGSLTVRTERPTAASASPSRTPAPASRRAPRSIFDPFFTTKPR